MAIYSTEILFFEQFAQMYIFGIIFLNEHNRSVSMSFINIQKVHVLFNDLLYVDIFQEPKAI